MPRAKQRRLLSVEPETQPLFSHWAYHLPDEILNHQAALKAGMFEQSWDAKTPTEKVRAKEQVLAGLARQNRTERSRRFR